MTRPEAKPPPLVVARKSPLDEVSAAVRSGDLASAKRLAGALLSQGMEHPLLLNLRALEHEDAGRFESALTDLRRAHILAPGDFAILNACGLCLARLERAEEALRCYDRALAIRPDFGPAWFNRGWALERLGESAKAAETYARAAEINPENAHAWANMAFLAARRRDSAAVREYADRALGLQPGHATAILALAESEMSGPAVAEARLRDLLSQPLAPTDAALALGLLGDALDAQDRPAEAFPAYRRSNALFREEAKPRFEAPGAQTVPQTLTWLVRWAEGLDSNRWRTKRGAVTRQDGETDHVFLIGFPRSGTTLIESVLVNHPDVISLEERDTLHAGVLDFLTDPRALSRLEAMSDQALQPYRDDYWARVKGFGAEPAGKVFIDKYPLHTLKLPLIYKLFPDARIIFAVRDPRDVVLSCFRRRFNLNPSMYEFLDLERTAANYVGVMRLAAILREKQPMAEHRLVYERLIEDFAGQAREVCDFISIDWRDDLADIAARARRGDVASASAAQIARGVYSDGVGHWRRYRTELAPVLAILAPWVAHFGYPAD